MISQGEDIMDIFFLNNQGMIETKHEYVIYSTRNKGYVNLKHRISKKDWDKVFIGEEKVLLKKDEKLFLYKGRDNYEEMKNFTFSNKHIITQMEDILIVVGEGEMYKLFLDEIGPEMIVMKNLPVFGNGFTNYNGFIHNSSGKQNIFYNSGKDVSIVSSPVKLKGVFQDRNVGILQYEEKRKMKQKFFKIDGMNLKISQGDIDGMRHFAYLPNLDSSGKPESEGMIFTPEDGEIDIYRTNDFEKIGSLSFDLISTESIIQKSNCGLVVWEGNDVAILNKK